MAVRQGRIKRRKNFCWWNNWPVDFIKRLCRGYVDCCVYGIPFVVAHTFDTDFHGSSINGLQTSCLQIQADTLQRHHQRDSLYISADYIFDVCTFWC